MKFADLYKDPFYKECRKMLFLLLGAIVLCKLSKGLFGFVIIMMGMRWAVMRRPAYALICFALLTFLVILNPFFGVGGAIGSCARVGTPAMAVAMLMAAGQRRGSQALPVLGLLAYAAVAVISSINGYAPLISFMKLVNFLFFIVGIYAGTKNIDRSSKEIYQLRTFFFAFSAFIVMGSLALKFLNPGAAYFIAADALGGDGQAAAASGFLCGVVNHSQCLGPTVACVAGWLLADMLFVEKRFMAGHVLVLAMCPVVLYFTQSRTSLVALVAALGIMSLYCVPKFKVSDAMKRRLSSMMRAGLAVLFAGAVWLEISSGGVHKWLIKHNNADDSKSVSVDTLTSSRRGLIEESLYDFRQNPLFGKGFQVSFDHKDLNAKGKLVLSAPMEKGFMPTMILGETGIAGALVFVIFLCGFYSTCTSKGYYATIALFTTVLATNLGEATFFSPGGTGGPVWIIALMGGFVIDMAIMIQRREEALAQMMPQDEGRKVRRKSKRRLLRIRRKAQ